MVVARDTNVLDDLDVLLVVGRDALQRGARLDVHVLQGVASPLLNVAHEVEHVNGALPDPHVPWRAVSDDPQAGRKLVPFEAHRVGKALLAKSFQLGEGVLPMPVFDLLAVQRIQ